MAEKTIFASIYKKTVNQMRNQVTRHNAIHGILSSQILPVILGGGKILFFNALQANLSSAYKYINKLITPTTTRHEPSSGRSFLYLRMPNGEMTPSYVLSGVPTGLMTPFYVLSGVPTRLMTPSYVLSGVPTWLMTPSYELSGVPTTTMTLASWLFVYLI